MGRSGSTFFNRKLLGMIGSEWHSRGGNFPMEIPREEFFIKNEIEYLIKHEPKFDSRIHHRIYGPKYKNRCYYSTNKYTIEEMVNACKSEVFKCHLGQINKNYNLIKKIKSPILFLIRQDNWSRMLSKYCAIIKELMPSHLYDDLNWSKTIDVEISKSDFNDLTFCGEIQRNLIKTFQRELKDQKNVKFIYYEDIERPAYWTDEFINELEDFMGVKFANRNHVVPLKKKNRNFINWINKEDVINKELIEKNWINKI